MTDDNVFPPSRDREGLTLPQLILSCLNELGEPRKPMSVREASARSGGRVPPEMLRDIIRGEHAGPLTDSAAQGLADALDIPVATVYAALRVDPGSAGE